MADKKWKVLAETCDMRSAIVLAADEDEAIQKFLIGDTLEEANLTRAAQTEFDVYSVEEINA